MENRKSTQLRRFQTICKTGLRWSAALLAEIFVLWTLLQYMVRERDYLRYQKWIGVAVLTAAAVYVAFTALTDREEFSRIRASLRKMCSLEQIMLVLLLLWYLLDCAVRSRLDGQPLFKFNDNRLFMFTLTVFLFFPFVELMGSQAKRIMETMLHVTMAVYTPITVWCIWKYYNVEFFAFPSGYWMASYRETVSMKMGGNVNVTASAAVILFGLSLYMLLTHKGLVRLIYSLTAIVYFCAELLTNSRTSFLALLCVSVASAVLFMWDKLEKRQLKQRIIGALAGAVMAVIIVIAVQSLLFRMFAHVYPTFLEINAQRAAAQEAARQEAEAKAAAEAEAEAQAQAAIEAAEAAGTAQTAESAEYAEDVEPAASAESTAEQHERLIDRALEKQEQSTAPQTANSPATKNAQGAGSPAKTQEAGGSTLTRATDDVTETGARKMTDMGGRTLVWKVAVKIICSSPDHMIFGVSPCYVASRLQKEGQLGENVSHAHNGLLQVAIGLGIPAMLLFLIFEIGIIVRCLTIVFKGRGVPFRYSWIIPVIIAGILLTELVESMIFLMGRVNVPAFYMLAGCAVRMCRQIKAQKQA